MKLKFSFLMLLLAGSFLMRAQNQGHPTISGFEVSHMAVAQPTPAITPASPVGLYVVSQATITLIAVDSVSKIHFKVLDPSNNNSVVYEVDYPINTPAIVNQAGTILYKNTNGTIFISSGQTVALKNYAYHISTEDSQQNLSPLFFEIQ